MSYCQQRQGLHLNHTWRDIRHGHRFPIGENDFRFMESPDDLQPLVTDRHTPGEWILSFESDAPGRQQLNAQHAQEQSHRREPGQWIALAHAGPFFGVVTGVEGAVLFQVLYDARHVVSDNAGRIGTEAIFQQAFTDEQIPKQVDGL